MKKLALVIALLVSVCAFAQIEKVIPPKPNPPRLVNDLAGVLIPEQREALERKLVAYDDSTSNQITVVTVNTTGDYDIQEVALGILRSWGVGGTQNNGVVILAAVQDRKVFISTGYGLEGAIPDITAKTIVENDVLPAFREQNYYRGFDAAANSIFRAAAGEYKAPEGYRNRGQAGSKGFSIGKLILGIIILIIILNMFGGGNRGGGYMSRRGYRGFWGPTIFPTGGGFGGGGWGGGSSGGGGFGGGFGGFGGGSGGGGGAGGSW